MSSLLRVILRSLNSRKGAAYLLGGILAILVLSGLLPSEVSTSAQEWERLSRERPLLFGISKMFSTPTIVRSVPFLVISGFLFLSTLICTVNRVTAWLRMRALQFEREKAFSFSRRSQLDTPYEALTHYLSRGFEKARWRVSVVHEQGFEVLSAHKGGTVGFWGSIVFHIGLLVCFVAIPVSASTVFRGQFVATNGINTPLKEGLIYHEGAPLSSLPDMDITLRDLKGTYSQGIYKIDFRGVIEADGKPYPVAVNSPADIQGYQFTLHEFGFSPNLVLKRNGQVVFDFYLNLRHAGEEDIFEIPSQSTQVSVILMPDFFREGSTIGSKSNDPKNPVMMVRLFQNSNEVGKGLVALGSEGRAGEYEIQFPDLSNWANFVLVRERGLGIMMFGMGIGLLGLLFRFLSNERLLECRMEPGRHGTTLVIQGYSKYYPAFLEREVTEMSKSMEGHQA